MPMPEPVLDDLRFQKDLVDEARRRIIRYCPEWTDYNLSDPGITLIELFAWMTELITYRLNRVPEKNHLQFLNLLGVQLQPASSARVELTFYLSTLFPIRPGDATVAVVPIGTAVATRHTDEDPEIVYTTDARLVIVPPVMTELRREEEFHKNYQPRLGVETFHAFNARRPQPGDTFYIGFDPERDLSGHIVQLDFVCEETEATGIKRSDPPLVWEAAVGGGNWQEVIPSTFPDEKDTTGGLNNPRGSLTLHLPLDLQPDQVNGRTGYWLRCRFEQRRKEQGFYTQSPRILNLAAFSRGATTRATHAVIVADERLGISAGEPGQVFRLQHAPVLALLPGEQVEVEEKRDDEVVFIPWECVKDFADSDRFERHFTLDIATGEVAFGPSIRQSNGSVRQYGRVPEAGRAVRFCRYRYGGGTIGNVPASRIEVLKTALPYVDRVTNLRAAEGGRDQETLEEAKLRARREIRIQQRAVTAEDFILLAKGASRSVARAQCVTPGAGADGQLPPGMVEVLIVPAVFDSLQAGDLSRLQPEAELLRTVQNHLDRFRLLTTSLRLGMPNYVGVQVTAEIVVSEYFHPEAVQAEARTRLQHFLTPLAIGHEELLTDLLGTAWEGWPFGRALYLSELYSLIQSTPGVKHVLEVQVSQRPVIPGQERPPQAEAGPSAPAGRPLTPVTQRRLEVPAATLLCSLNHEIKVVEL